MDRQMVLDHLALAEGHIAEGKIAIERQQTLIAELEQGGKRVVGAFAQRCRVEPAGDS